jgi:hypothetical protein
MIVHAIKPKHTTLTNRDHFRPRSILRLHKHSGRHGQVSQLTDLANLSNRSINVHDQARRQSTICMSELRVQDGRERHHQQQSLHQPLIANHRPSTPHSSPEKYQQACPPISTPAAFLPDYEQSLTLPRGERRHQAISCRPLHRSRVHQHKRTRRLIY